jgi:hypothetical protein
MFFYFLRSSAFFDFPRFRVFHCFPLEDLCL